MFVPPNLYVDEAAIALRFVRASGPGGQNVNKVASAVELRFDVARSGIADAAVLARLRLLAGRRLTADGTLVLQADRFRTQEANRRDARGRLADLLARAAVPPRARHATAVPRRSREARLEDKRARSATKAARTASGEGDDA